LDVIAGYGTAPTQDAGIPIKDEERFGIVHRRVSPWHMAALEEPESGAGIGELTKPRPIQRGGRHTAREVKDPVSDPCENGIVSRDHHPLAGGEMTGSWKAVHPFDLDQAGPAGAEGRAVGILAELREREAKPVHGVEDRGAGLDRHPGSVDGQTDDRIAHLHPFPVISGVVESISLGN
jgi:hypothetical protein